MKYLSKSVIALLVGYFVLGTAVQAGQEQFHDSGSFVSKSYQNVYIPSGCTITATANRNDNGYASIDVAGPNGFHLGVNAAWNTSSQVTSTVYDRPAGTYQVFHNGSGTYVTMTTTFSW